MEETSIVDIGKRIKFFRISQGISQSELASSAGIERAQLSRIESGEVLGVTYLTIEKILNSLNKHLIINEKNSLVRDVTPFVKWAGGKTQLLETISKYLPNDFNRYFEPFVGGGALLFYLLPKSFVINDLNSELIAAYKCFLDEEKFNRLKELLIEHEIKHSEEYYYKIRDLDKSEDFSSLPIEVRAARMIYLNKSCFNGLYRVNSKGYFNVPSGKKKNVKCFNRDNFQKIYNFFKGANVIISELDFEEAVKDAKKGDFVYFDPPYDSFEEKETFTSYSKDDFTREDQKRLARLVRKLCARGVYVMASNHNTPFIRKIYEGFNIHVIPAKRMINSDPNGRGEVEEVIITNY